MEGGKSAVLSWDFIVSVDEGRLLPLIEVSASFSVEFGGIPVGDACFMTLFSPGGIGGRLIVEWQRHLVLALCIVLCIPSLTTFGILYSMNSGRPSFIPFKPLRVICGRKTFCAIKARRHIDTCKSYPTESLGSKTTYILPTLFFVPCQIKQLDFQIARRI